MKSVSASHGNRPVKITAKISDDTDIGENIKNVSYQVAITTSRTKLTGHFTLAEATWLGIKDRITKTFDIEIDAADDGPGVPAHRVIIKQVSNTKEIRVNPFQEDEKCIDVGFECAAIVDDDEVFPPKEEMVLMSRLVAVITTTRDNDNTKVIGADRVSTFFQPNNPICNLSKDMGDAREETKVNVPFVE